MRWTKLRVVFPPWQPDKTLGKRESVTYLLLQLAQPSPEAAVPPRGATCLAKPVTTASGSPRGSTPTCWPACAA